MDQQDRIQAYLDGTLTPSDRQTFETELQTNPILAEELLLQREAIALLKLDRQRAYKSQLQTIAQREATQIRTAPVVALWQRRWLQIAAAVVLLFGVGWLLQQAFSGPVDYQELAMSAYEPYPDRLNVRGEQEISATLVEGMQAYGQQDYAQAISLLSQVPESDSLYLPTRFYLGNAYLSHQQAKEAVEVFSRLQSNPDNLFREATDWYLALAYLANGQTEQGKILLQALANNDEHSYQARAQELL